MDDPNDPYSPDNLSWNWRFGGPKWRPSKAEREQEMRAEARAERLHLAGLTSGGVIIMSVILVAVVGMLVLVLVTRH
jgi:hypothetical protein